MGCKPERVFDVVKRRKVCVGGEVFFLPHHHRKDNGQNTYYGADGDKSRHLHI
jgi:hypothetical protein